MKIGQLAKQSGLSVHTIRYYERIGLLPFAVRDDSGHREYDLTILAWIKFLGRLKATGMPIREMLLYAKWRTQGEKTERQRHDLLVSHREQVKRNITEQQACLEVLDSKIDGYASQFKED